MNRAFVDIDTARRFARNPRHHRFYAATADYMKRYLEGMELKVWVKQGRRGTPIIVVEPFTVILDGISFTTSQVRLDAALASELVFDAKQHGQDVHFSELLHIIAVANTPRRAIDALEARATNYRHEQRMLRWFEKALAK